MRGTMNATSWATDRGENGSAPGQAARRTAKSEPEMKMPGAVPASTSAFEFADQRH